MNVKVAELENYYRLGSKGMLPPGAGIELANKRTQIPGMTAAELAEVRSKTLVTGFMYRLCVVALFDVRKDIVLSTVKYYSHCSKLFPEFTMHPETLKLLETIAYGVEYGLPVEKELLFKGMPELFGYEIRHLQDEMQHKYFLPRLDIGVIHAPDLYEQKKIDRPALSNHEILIEKTSMMTTYFTDQCHDFLTYYMPYIKEQTAAYGHEDEGDYLSDLTIMDEAKLTDVEKRMVAEIKAIRNIDADIEALRVRSKEITLDDMDIPPFPIIDPKFRAQCIQTQKHCARFAAKSVVELGVVPINARPPKTFIDRLRESGFNIDAEISRGTWGELTGNRSLACGKGAGQCQNPQEDRGGAGEGRGDRGNRQPTCPSGAC